MVGLNGIGPSTSPLSGVRSNQLSYRPNRTLGSKPNRFSQVNQAIRVETYEEADVFD